MPVPLVVCGYGQTPREVLSAGRTPIRLAARRVQGAVLGHGSLALVDLDVHGRLVVLSEANGTDAPGEKAVRS